MAKITFRGTQILLKLWFLSKKFGSENAKKPIKRSKDSNYSLFPKQT